MTPDEVFKRVGKVPYMKVTEARIFYDFIVKNELRRGLELGFFHGMSSCYLAGALEELAGGHLTTIDLLTAKDREPNIEFLLSSLDLRELVDVYYETKSFTWRLMRFLQEGRRGCFDYCYFDGAHTWDDTGFAFCLVDQLLAPGGWAIFDDLYFTFAKSSNREKGWVKRLPAEEQTEEQVLRVFELLVQTHPQFTNFRRIGGRFAFAQKVEAGSAAKEEMMAVHDAIAVSKALERAYNDPEFREQLLVAPDSALAEVTKGKKPSAVSILFEEAQSFGPKPARREGGGFIVPIEHPSWETVTTRAQMESLLSS